MAISDPRISGHGPLGYWLAPADPWLSSGTHATHRVLLHCIEILERVQLGSGWSLWLYHTSPLKRSVVEISETSLPTLPATMQLGSAGELPFRVQQFVPEQRLERSKKDPMAEQSPRGDLRGDAGPSAIKSSKVAFMSPLVFRKKSSDFCRSVKPMSSSCRKRR